jgi:hypothetical protein
MITPRPTYGVPPSLSSGYKHNHQPTRRVVILGLGSLMLAGCKSPSGPSFHPPPARTRPLEHGVCLAGGPQDRAAVSAYTALAGSPAQWMLLFCDWALTHPPLQALDAAIEQGAMPILTWEPWHAPSPEEAASSAGEQPPFSLLAIAAGDHDEHIRTWAQDLSQWGRDIVLRFAHEMNGDWYPWGAGVQGNTPDQYVQAWRHVRNVFDTTGAHNVRWCWAPNVPDGLLTETATMLMDFFPGADAVDLLGLDGYNWGPARSTGWIEAPTLFRAGIQELRSLRTDLPILITETASAEAPNDDGAKAAWITELFTYTENQGDIQAIIWFHLDKELDWRITSSPQSQVAYHNAVTQLHHHHTTGA